MNQDNSLHEIRVLYGESRVLRLSKAKIKKHKMLALFTVSCMSAHALANETPVTTSQSHQFLKGTTVTARAWETRNAALITQGHANGNFRRSHS